MASTQRWIPLESNPKVLNKYVHGLGMDKNWSFVDVFGLDPDLLAVVPQPVAALVLLYPYLSLKTEDGSSVIGDVQPDYPADLYYTKQTIGNACGTVAIVHALANNQDKIPFDSDLHFKTFLEMTKAMSPEERAAFLEQDQKMGAAHEDCAQEGETEAPPEEEKVKFHFVALVHFNGSLYELDGRKKGPVIHGKTTQETLLQDAADVIKKYMEHNPNDLNFNVMALVSGADD